MIDRSDSLLGVNCEEAAKLLGVTTGTLRRWSDEGYIECYRTPGGKRRFSKEQIQLFVNTARMRQTAITQRHSEVSDNGR